MMRQTSLLLLLAGAAAWSTAPLPDNLPKEEDLDEIKPSDKVMGTMSAKMPLARALRVVNANAPQELVSYLETTLAKAHNVSFLQEAGSDEDEEEDDDDDDSMIDYVGTKAVPPSGALLKAFFMLNEMLTESENKFTAKWLFCWQGIKRLKEVLKITAIQLLELSADLARARSEVSYAQAIISKLTEEIPQVKATLIRRMIQFRAQKLEFERDISKLEEDRKIIGGIMEMAKCKKQMMLQCNHMGSNPTSFTQFATPALRNLTNHLSPTVHAKLTKALQTSMAAEINREVFAGPPPTKGVKPSSGGPNRGKNTKQLDAKCSVSASPVCHKIQERFFVIQSETVDLLGKRKGQLGWLMIFMKRTYDDMTADIKMMTRNLMNAQTLLNEATADINKYTAEIANKKKVFVKTVWELKKLLKECKKELQAFVAEACGIRKIRRQVCKMNQIQKKFCMFKDCMTDRWRKTKCSRSCGSYGKMVLYRRITQQANKFGSNCSSTRAVMTCNRFGCPVRCRVGRWGGWSSCSAACGGGVMMRSRRVKQPARNGGSTCPAIQQQQTCNTQSCNKNCALSPWTRWTKCSKACNTGFMFRYRHVARLQRGNGRCWKWANKRRYNVRRCNKTPCPKFGDKQIQVCQSRLDVILLLDGSGSVRSKGWKKTVEIAQLLRHAFIAGNELKSKTHPNAAMGVILFSGPRSWAGVRICARKKNMGAKARCSTCGLCIVDELTRKNAVLKKDIAAMKWPRASTFTANAVMRAITMMQLGGAKRSAGVFVLVTDGRPFSTRRTTNAIHQAKKMGKFFELVIMGRSINSYMMRLMKKWCSEPVAQYFFAIKGYNMIHIKLLSLVVQNLCPNIKSTGKLSRRVMMRGAKPGEITKIRRR